MAHNDHFVVSGSRNYEEGHDNSLLGIFCAQQQFMSHSNFVMKSVSR